MSCCAVQITCGQLSGSPVVRRGSRPGYELRRSSLLSSFTRLKYLCKALAFAGYKRIRKAPAFSGYKRSAKLRHLPEQSACAKLRHLAEISARTQNSGIPALQDESAFAATRRGELFRCPPRRHLTCTLSVCQKIQDSLS